jgi:hypothetical protein
MTDPPLSAMATGGSGLGPRMERCLLGNKVVMLPEAMVERVCVKSIFFML